MLSFKVIMWSFELIMLIFKVIILVLLERELVIELILELFNELMNCVGIWKRNGLILYFCALFFLLWLFWLFSLFFIPLLLLFLLSLFILKIGLELCILEFGDKFLVTVLFMGLFNCGRWSFFNQVIVLIVWCLFF